MRVKRLEMVGFKSFASRTVLDLAPGISILVGPNGSGKSNVADAVRWVLGEGRARAVRARKAEEVIFAGSSTRQPLGLSEVSLLLDNVDGALALPYEEVRVTRRLYRSGETDYLLNASRVRLKDVVQYLTQAGLGHDGYCVIGQGAVEEFILQRPEERQLMLEAAAGVRVYQLKLAESRSKLEATRQNLLRTEDTLAELQPHLRRLEVQAQRAERAQRLRDELFALSRTWYRASFQSSAAARRAAEQKAVVSQQALEAQERQSKQFQIQARALGASLSQAAQEVRSLQDRLASLHGEREHAVRRHSTASERLHALAEQRNAGGALIIEAADRRRKLVQEHASLGEEAEKKVAAASALEEGLASLDSQLAQSAAAVEQARAELRGLEQERDRIDARLEAAEPGPQVGRRDGSKRQLAIELRRLEAGLRAALRKLESSSQLVIARAREAEQARNSREASHDALRAAMMAESRLDAELVRATARADAATAALETHRADSGSDGLPRLGELISSLPGYELAIMAALDYLATALVAQNQAASEALVRVRDPQQARPLTLVCIEPPTWFGDDAAVSKRCAQALGDIDGWKQASELVTCAPQHRSLIDRCLRRAFVVATSDEAANVARRLSALPDAGWQAVSLDGQVWGWRGEWAVGPGAGARNLIARQRDTLRLEAEASLAAGLARQGAEERQAAVIRRREAEADVHALAERTDAAAAAELEARSLAAEAQQTAESLRIEMELCRQRLARLEDNGKDSSTVAASALATMRKALRRSEDALRQAADRAVQAESKETDLRRRRELRQRDLAKSRAEADATQQLIHWRWAEAERARATEEAAIQKLQSLEAHLHETSSDLDAASDLLRSFSEKIDALEQTLSHQQRELEQAVEARQSLEERLAAVQQRLNLARDTHNKRRMDVERAQIEIQRVTREAEEFLAETDVVDEATFPVQMWLGLKPGAAADDGSPLAPPDLDSVRRGMLAKQREVRALGAVGSGVLEEYRELKDRVDFLSSQAEDLRASMARLTSAAQELERTVAQRFFTTLDQVNAAFQESFVALFGGGSAQLVLSDEPPTSSTGQTGIDVVVKPPGKRLQELMSLSGGERSLASIALLMALLSVNPAPFVLLDEVDAALDEANIQRFARMLRRHAERVQFLVVTHNRATMEIGDALFGVTMDAAGVSRVLSLRLSDVAMAS